MSEPLVISPTGRVELSGDNRRRLELRVGKARNKGELAIQKLLEGVFHMKTRGNSRTVDCLYDEVLDHGEDGVPLYSGAYYFGALYDWDSEVTTLFVRRFVDFNGPLDLWRNGVLVDTNVGSYGGFAVLPDCANIPKSVACKAGNMAVQSFDWKHIEDLGYDLDAILEELTDEKHKV